jgi:hypothetical protein
MAAAVALAISLALSFSGQAPGAQPAPAEKVWFLGVDGHQQGPMTAAEVEKQIKGGKAKADTLCWREGQPNWTPLAETAAFRAYFVKPPPLPAAAEPRPPPLPGATSAPPAPPTAPSAPPSGGRAVIGAPPPTAPSAPPSGGRAVIGAPPPDPEEDAPPTAAEVAAAKAATARDDRTRALRRLQHARERSAAASDDLRTQGLVWGGAGLGLGGAAIVAGLFAGSTSDPTLRPGCSLLSCGLCVGCLGSLAAGGVLSALNLQEMSEADAEVAAAEANANAMRY